MQNIAKENLIYVSVKEVALVSGFSRKCIWQRCLKNKYICRTSEGTRGGNRGKSYEILLSSLEPEIQEKILKAHPELLTKVNNYITQDRNNSISLDIADSNGRNFTGIHAPFSLDSLGCAADSHSFPVHENKAAKSTPVSLDFLSEARTHTSLVLNDTYTYPRASFPLVVPEKAKSIALARKDLVRHWEAFRSGKKNKAAADKEFEDLYNSKALSIAIFSVLGEVSVKTLSRWAKMLKDGNNKYEVLLPSYNYGGESELRTQMSELERSMFIDVMMKNNNIKVGRAYEFVGYKLRERGIETQSSISSYHRLWKFVNRNFYAETIFAREGEKAAKDKKLPSLKRDYTRLDVGDEIVADGHVLDFDLINPFTGKPKRLTLIAFQDCASRDILGWEIMPTENTQAIASAFRNAVLRLGKLPKIVYLDNGRAFKGKYFTGCQSFMESGIGGIYESLGITVKFTQPYNGRSKIIERYFREFTESLAVTQDFYVGNSIANKPAYLMRNERFHRMLKEGKEVPTIDEFKEVLNHWLENIYRKRPCPNNRKMSIGEYFAQGKGEGVNPELLDEFIMAQ